MALLGLEAVSGGSVDVYTYGSIERSTVVYW